MERWEYFTTFIEAQMEQIDPVEMVIPQGEHPKYSPYALMPELNRLGDKGWELVHMQPVIIGRNHDVLLHDNSTRYWTSCYFCVFKRRL